MFRGRHDHAIDGKGRLSIPAVYRIEIQRRSEKPPILTTGLRCLALWPFDAWEVFEEQRANMDPLDAQAQRTNRFFFFNAVEAPFDGQGRILIPKFLRAHAAIERDVTIAGHGPKIEIWNSDLLLQELEESVAGLNSPQAATASPDK
jgi:MraZ protein